MLVIDIGTHKAEELKVLAGARCFILKHYLRWWLNYFNRVFKNIFIPGSKECYGRGTYLVSPVKCGFNTHQVILKQLIVPKNYLKDTKVVCIDPAAEVTVKYVKEIAKKANVNYLPLAILPHTDASNCKLIKFYQAENSLSSSLFADAKNNTSVSLAVGVSFKHLLEHLKDLGMLDPSTRVVMRMNCEGAELGVLEPLFTSDIAARSTVLGSLGDVKKKFGEAVHASMLQQMREHQIAFSYFKGSDPSTWLAGIEVFARA